MRTSELAGLLLLGACADGLKRPGSDDTSRAGDSDTHVATDSDDETGGTGAPDDTGPCISTRWYPDEDEDGHGTSTGAVWACDSPRGYVVTSDDCDDSDNLTYPGAAEACGDGVYNDCGDSTGAVAIAACPPEGPYQVGASDVQLVGYQGRQEAGYSVGSAGDANGDGLDDVLVGTGVYSSSYAFRALGPLSGRISMDMSSTIIDPGDSVTAVGDAGDQDGDGLADMLVAASGASRECGRVGLVLATTTGMVGDSDLDASVEGEAEGDYLGRAAAGVGDVDIDGWDDWLVGAPSWDTGHLVSPGAVYLLCGPVAGTGDVSTACARFDGTADGGYLGMAVARGGDLNGDGLADVLLSAPGAGDSGDLPGTVYAEYGPVTGIMSVTSADVMIEGNNSSESLGAWLGGNGDVNGDGYADIVIGAPDANHGAGGAYLMLGPASGTSTDGDAEAYITPESDGDHVGQGVSIVGDVGADGFDDLLVGAPGANAAYLLYGPVSGWQPLESADVKFTGGPLVYDVGWSVAGAGDVDGDGLADLLIGAPSTSVEGDDAGAAYIVFAAGTIMSGGYGP